MSDVNATNRTRPVFGQGDTRVSPASVWRSLTGHFDLVKQMTRRMVAGRYRGSLIGMSWSLFYPILMLMVYTFVFGVVFNMRGLETGGGKGSFAMTLFGGLICHQFFAECLSRAPNLVVGNVQYVKKVVFPLHVLPWVAIGAALFQTSMSFVILVLFNLILTSELHWTIIFVPVVFAPFALLTAGLVWFIAGFSVYVRDVAHVIGVLTTMLLFLSPVFYSVDRLPEAMRPFIYVNPLSFIIEQFRAVVLHGQFPDWIGLGIYTAIALLVAWAGLRWFQKVRNGFADVL